MGEKLRIVFWIIIVEITLTKTWWNSRRIKKSRTSIRPSAFAYGRALTWFDSRPRTIATLTDDVIGRCFALTVLRPWNLVKCIYHWDNLPEEWCEQHNL